ncbi:MAG: integrin alpha [bacterium]
MKNKKLSIYRFTVLGLLVAGLITAGLMIGCDSLNEAAEPEEATVTMTLAVGEEQNFTLGGETHKVTFVSLVDDTATLQIESTPIILEVTINDDETATVLVDVNNDGVYDYSVTLTRHELELILSIIAASGSVTTTTAGATTTTTSEETVTTTTTASTSSPTTTTPAVASLLYQKDGAVAEDYLGYSVAGAGDVDGDGNADFIIGAVAADPNEIDAAGSAYVYSGADGSILFQKNGGSEGDVFGHTVAGAGDVNDDGKADFIVGATWADPNEISGAGSAYVYSGTDGALLYQKDGVAAGDNFGYSVAGAGDVNGDGNADFIVGTGFANPNAMSDAGSAYVYSGADGTLLYQKDGEAAGDRFGHSVAGVGDVDVDGNADFIVGAYVANLSSGSVYVYSGAAGTLLYQKDGGSADALGVSVAGAGDVNGDSIPDFIVGAIWADPNGINAAGSAYVYSGADGTLLFQKDGEATTDFFGSSVAGAGDVNGDGKADFIVGTYRTDPNGLTDAGSAYIYISQ